VTLSSSDRGTIVDSLARMVERLYVSADTGRLIAAHLRERAQAGAYDKLARTTDLAVVLTRDLRAINSDGHLAVDRPPPPPTAGAGRGADPAKNDNYNFERVEHLPGNVGYLRMSGFAGSPQAFKVATSALELLAASDAVIIDLRNSRGGGVQMANFIISHFSPADTTRSLGVYRRQQNDTIYRWTMGTVPGPRRPDVPLYILVDHVTRSAAEDVTFVLQAMGRAVVVGENTAGAGHNNGVFPLGAGLVAIISVTRVFDATTHREWERVGVTPNVVVAPSNALTTAHSAALARLAAAAPNPTRREELNRIRDAVLASAKPLALSAAAMAKLAGDYAGAGLILVEGGALVQQSRRDQPRQALAALSPTRFIVGTALYDFSPDTNGRRQVRVSAPGEADVTYARVGDVPLWRGRP
jgi:hypothetical protein